MIRILVHIFAAIIFCCEVFASPSAQSPKIGMILPLSGPLAEFGIAARNGIEMAKVDGPEHFRKIEFLYEDSQYDGKKSLSAFRKLVDIDKANLTFVWGSTPSHSIAPVAEQTRTPTFLVTTEADATKNRNYVFRFCTLSDPYAQILLKHFRKSGFKKLGIVKTDLEFFDTVVNSLRSSLNSDESLEIESLASAADTDFRSLISKLKGRRYDALGVFVVGGQISQFFLQKDALKYSVPTFGTNTLENRGEMLASKGTMVGTVYPTMYATEDFHQKYKARFGNDILYVFAAQAYDFAMLAADVVASIDVTQDTQKLLNEFAKTKQRKGVSGTFEYVYGPDSGKGFDFPVVLYQVGNDDFAPVK